MLNPSDVSDDPCDEDGCVAGWIGFSDIDSSLLARDQLGVEAIEGSHSDLRSFLDDGHLDCVTLFHSFADHKVDVNASRDDGATSLILASCKGHKTVVAELLKAHEVDVNAANSEGATALISACASGHFEIVCELLKLASVNGDVEKTVDNKDTRIASGINSNTDVVDWDLLESEHVDVHVSEGRGNKELRAASVDGKLEEVRLPGKRRVLDVNAKKVDGSTALLVACGNGHLKIVCELLQNKEVDVNAKNVAGETSSTLARGHGHADVVSALRKHENAGESACI